MSSPDRQPDPAPHDEGRVLTSKIPSETPTASPAVDTVLWTAATHRPLEEVAAIVDLLQQPGAVPDAADGALRAAADGQPAGDQQAGHGHHRRQQRCRV
ncbi:hypothetical protein EF918_35695, partial [Streptomyces sp. WAC06614]